MRVVITQPQDLCSFDVEILCEQDNGYADDIDGHDQAQCQSQGIPDIFPHVSGEEEADNGKGVPFSGRGPGVENAGQGVQAGHQHEAEEQVGEKRDADYLDDPFGLDFSLVLCVHAITPSSFPGGYAMISAGSNTTETFWLSS